MKWGAAAVAIAGLTLAVACVSGGPARPPATCEGIENFFIKELNPYQDAVDVATTEYSDEQWRVETADPEADPKKVSERFSDLQKAIYHKEILQRTQELDDATKDLSAEKCVYKTRLKRARGLLETAILVNPAVIQKEKENQDLQDAMVVKSNGFRMTLPGEKEPVSRAIYQKMLGSIANRKEREKLYHRFQAARAKAWLDWGFKTLIRNRNEEGKLAGYPDYYTYRFYRNELDLGKFLADLKEIREKLAPKVQRSFRRFAKRSGISKIEGWDIRYLREKSASGDVNRLLEKAPATLPLDLARKFYRGMGFDIDAYHFDMDLYPRPGKNTHAFAMAIVMPHIGPDGAVLPEPKPDIRFLANLKQPVKWNDVSTVIHELGHAVHAAEVRQRIGLFRGIDSVPTEAIAMTMERMAGSVEFQLDTLPDVTGIAVAKLKPLLKKQASAAQLEQAFMLLRQAFFSDFEYRIYQNPDADFAGLWSEMHKTYWGIDVSPAEADWDVEHFLMAPVYVQNYAIGILMVEQIYDSIRQTFHTSYHSTELGDKLKKVYFAPGEEFDYLDLTQHFTGKPLSTQAALNLLD